MGAQLEYTRPGASGTNQYQYQSWVEKLPEGKGLPGIHHDLGLEVHCEAGPRHRKTFSDWELGSTILQGTSMAFARINKQFPPVFFSPNRNPGLTRNTHRNFIPLSLKKRSCLRLWIGGASITSQLNAITYVDELSDGIVKVPAWYRDQLCSSQTGTTAVVSDLRTYKLHKWGKEVL